MPSRLIRLEDCLTQDEIMKRFVYIQIARLHGLKYIEPCDMEFLTKQIKPQYRLRLEALKCMEGLHEQVG